MFTFSVSYGATGVWVGTRFVASVEAGAPPKHKEMVLKASHDDVIRTTIYTGRPMSVYKSTYIADWYVHRCAAVNSNCSMETGKRDDAKS